MRYLGGLLTLVAIGCGSSPKPVTPSNGGEAGTGGNGEVSTVRGDPTPESICARVFELKQMTCEVTSSYDLTQDECVDDFHRSFEDRGPDARQAVMNLGRCLIDNGSCEAVGECIEDLSKDAQGFRECGTSGIEPVAMPADEWLQREEAKMVRFSQARSSKEDPIEVCGIWEAGGQLEWLISKTCNDGSRAWTSIHQAHASRVGNVGAGGRCGSIIDLYEVPCPEGTYSIYIDAYVCPQE